MAEAEVETLGVLVLLALAVMVGLVLLVLLGRVDNPEWLARPEDRDQLDLAALKALKDRREAEEAALLAETQTKATETQEDMIQTIPAKPRDTAKNDPSD